LTWIACCHEAGHAARYRRNGLLPLRWPCCVDQPLFFYSDFCLDSELPQFGHKSLISILVQIVDGQPQSFLSESCGDHVSGQVHVDHLNNSIMLKSPVPLSASVIAKWTSNPSKPMNVNVFLLGC